MRPHLDPVGLFWSLETFAEDLRGVEIVVTCYGGLNK